MPLQELEARIHGWMALTLATILVRICIYYFKCMKFGQLILRRIIKIVATRCQDLRLKCTKFDFGWGSAPDRTGGAYSAAPDPIAEFKEPTSKGREGKWGKGIFNKCFKTLYHLQNNQCPKPAWCVWSQNQIFSDQYHHNRYLCMSSFKTVEEMIIIMIIKFYKKLILLAFQWYIYNEDRSKETQVMGR